MESDIVRSEPTTTEQMTKQSWHSEEIRPTVLTPTGLQAMPEAQRESLKKLESKWKYVGNGYFDPLNKCFMVAVAQSKEERTTWLGIELDGHVHS